MELPRPLQQREAPDRRREDTEKIMQLEEQLARLQKTGVSKRENPGYSKGGEKDSRGLKNLWHNR